MNYLLWKIRGREVIFEVPVGHDDMVLDDTYFTSFSYRGEIFKGVAFPDRNRRAYVQEEVGTERWWDAVEKYQEYHGGKDE